MIFNYLKNRQLRKKNIFGHAEQDGKIVFFVEQKEPLCSLKKQDVAPKRILWKKCNVEEMQKPKVQALNRNVQVQRFGSNAVGTLGLVVKKIHHGGWIWSAPVFEHFGSDLEMLGINPVIKEYVLTNMHVAHELLQPTNLDTYGQPTSWIASARAFKYYAGDIDKDCALLEPITQHGKDWIKNYSFNYETEKPTIGMEVEKIGRTTNRTEGIITHKNITISADYLNGARLARNCIAVRGLNNKHFSRKGDSGSVVLKKDTNKVVGLLFAGSDTHSFFYPIEDVFEKLQVI